MKFLKNVKTGQILHSNPLLEKHEDLVPCPPPWEDDTDNDRVTADTKAVPPAGASEATPDGTAGPSKDIGNPGETDAHDNTLLSKQEGGVLVKKWFGREINQVRKADILAFAKDRTGEDLPKKLTKLGMVTRVAAELAAREAQAE